MFFKQSYKTLHTFCISKKIFEHKLILVYEVKINTLLIIYIIIKIIILKA